MIGSEIDFLSLTDFQLSNLWDFIIIEQPQTSDTTDVISAGSNSISGSLMKFKITTCNLPLPGLLTENTKVGKKHYVNREYEGDFQITILEDTLFSSFNYFDSWMKQIYDFDNQVWKKNPPVRTGMLLYYSSNLVVPTATFMYENLKVRGIETITQQRTNSEPLLLTINLTFEKVAPVNASSTIDLLKNKTLEIMSNI